MTTTINADNGVVSGSAGLKSSADSSGVLALQTNGTTALTLDASQNATFAGSITSAGSTGSLNSVNTFGFKNRIINGGMTIDQRNAGASVTPTGGANTYIVDRFNIYASQSSKLTAQQNGGAITPAVGFINYLGCTSSSAYTVGASEEFSINQPVEGLNVADLAWGTANAKTITLSFKVYSSLTGTFGGALRNSAGSRSYPFTYSIPVANTWTSISVTIAGDTTGTWLTTNGIGIRVGFGLGAGATVSGTAGAWAAANYVSATGATSVVGTSGATFYITGVQLEVGSQATSFDFRAYPTEFAMCQRYFEIFGNSGCGKADNTTQIEMSLPFCVSKRTAPTLALFNSSVNQIAEVGVNIRTVTSLSGGGGAGLEGAYIIAQVGAGGMTGGNLIIAYPNLSPIGFLSASAEL